MSRQPRNGDDHVAPGDDELVPGTAGELPGEEADPARNAFDRVVVRGGRIVAWLVFIAMAISVFEVIMRYAFDSPTSWVHESVVMLVAVTFALGGPVALAGNKHIRVRVIYDSAGPHFKMWLDRFNDLVTFAFCLAMSYAAFVMFWDSAHNPFGEWSLERSGTSWNPPFPSMVKGIIMIALMIMTVQALLHLFQSLRARAVSDDHDRGETR